MGSILTPGHKSNILIAYYLICDPVSTIHSNILCSYSIELKSNVIKFELIKMLILKGVFYAQKVFVRDTCSPFNANDISNYYKISSRF